MNRDWGEVRYPIWFDKEANPSQFTILRDWREVRYPIWLGKEANIIESIRVNPN